MKKLTLLSIYPVLVLGIVSCSSFDEQSYQRGYEAGYAEGRAIGKSEGEKTAKTTIDAAQAKIAELEQKLAGERAEKATSTLDMPTLSADEVIAIAGNDFPRFVDDVTNRNLLQLTDNSGRWSAAYSGNGKWEVKLTFTKLVATWYYYEKGATLQYWGMNRIP
jgi:hypothetical protein